MCRLVISNISKTYANGIKALDNISLEIPNGVFGLLGPNGAGKSTLMRTLATLQEVDEGAISFGDVDILTQKDQIRKRLGYLPQQFGLYPKITAEVLLDHLAILKGIVPRKERKEVVNALLHKTNLYASRKQRLGGFSGGMKQRFGIAQALLNNPKLLIVDEPTAGLDPAERNRFYNLLSEVGEQAVVILSTHIVDDVKELCTNMAIINNGKVLLKGNPSELIDGLQGKIYQKVVLKNDLEHYNEHYNVIGQRLFLGKPVIRILSDIDPGNGFEPTPAGLEEVYFSKVLEQHKITL